MLSNNAKITLGIGAIAAVGALWYLSTTPKGQQIMQSVGLDLGQNVQPGNYQTNTNFPDPNLNATIDNTQGYTGQNPNTPSCGCSSEQFAVSNDALSANLEKMYEGFASKYFDSITSSFPEYVSQYFNNTAPNTSKFGGSSLVGGFARSF